ncbi:MAG: ATP-dependent DNA helicase RecG [Treponema sp.]|nr:ATP-dependent DNA helicase RecG [Treponema sp.]
MFLKELKIPIGELRGVGPALTQYLARLGINDCAALLCHYPRDWDDRTRELPLNQWASGRVSTAVKILAKDWIGFGRSRTLKVYVEDQSTKASLICFNRPFLERQLQIGQSWRLFGQFSYKYGEIQSTAFELEAISEDEEEGYKGKILPLYPLTAGLNQTQLRRLMQRALGEYASPLENELPLYIREKMGLLPKSQAIRAIHFPESEEELQSAKRSLIYEELFYLEVMVGRRAMERKGQSQEGAQKAKEQQPGSSQGPPLAVELSPLQEGLLRRLPFSLTSGQEEAVREINRDMEGPFSMARLLQGDVGSGKTLVSFLAALRIVEKGGQGVLMAPTELLARQHAENAAKLLEPLGLRIAFLTGNLKAQGRAELLKALAAGDIDLVAGTHALFSRDIAYRNLRLVVVDEQHRFGVLQRQAIMAKGRYPHLLMMSATPIPRSLALTVFGDLDVSVIKDLPPGRKVIKTHLARESNEGKVYDFVRRILAEGRQAYFVYPLIEGGDEKDLKDAVSMADRLTKEVFPEYPAALLHSRVDDEDKQKIMEAFRRGETSILIATSVVEVGVDVPNATCMVIEHAERFGLAALHQMRGRVGRGDYQSYCFLVYSDNLNEDGKKRLMVMLEHNDGFIIAEEDLRLRGPGQISGLEQSGYLRLGIADIARDSELLLEARNEVFALLARDPELQETEHACMAELIHRAPPFADGGL